MHSDRAHICHIATTFNMKSGSAKRTADILNGCVRNKYHATLITGRDFDVTEKNLPGVNIIVVPQLFKYISVKNDISALWKLINILRKIKPDIVHTHLAKAGILGRVASKINSIPCIIHTVHGPTFAKGISPVKIVLFWMMEFLCRFCTDLFVFVGKELRENYVRAFICRREKTKIVRTGRTDKEFLYFSGSQQQDSRELRRGLCKGKDPEVLVMIVGRVVPSKQIDHAFLCIKELNRKEKKFDLAVVGEALLEEEKLYQKKLLALAGNLEIDDCVHFTGYRKDILKVMQAADVIVMTSKYEGLPNVAVESALVGTPIVTYSVSGAGEVIESGKTGFIVGNGNYEEMTRAIRTIVENPGVMAGFKENAFTHVKRKFDRRRMIEKKMSVYSNLLKKSIIKGRRNSG